MDEALRVGLVVDVFLAEGGEVFAVEAEGALAPGGDDVAFVEFQPHHAGDRALGGVHKGIQCLFQRAEPEAIVNQFGVFQRHGVFVLHGGVVEHQRFQLAVGFHQNRAAGGFVDPAGFHAHQAVFHHVDPADAVLAAQGVQEGDQLAGAHLLAVHGHGRAGFKLDFHIFRLIGGFLRGGGEHEHRLVRLPPRVFERAALVGNVPQVVVAAVDGLLGGGDGDVVRLGVGDGVFAGADLPLAPRGDDLQAGV